MKKTNQSILIVDDNQQNVKLLGEILSEEGYRLSIAQNGNQALKILDILVPDLIILDLMLPDINGFDVCRQIKINKKFQYTPIIVNSSLYSIEDKMKAFDAGAVDYINKPFYSVDFLKRIEIHLMFKNKLSPYNSDTSSQKKDEEVLIEEIKKLKTSLRGYFKTKEIESSIDIKLHLLLNELKTLTEELSNTCMA